ncbi:MAG: glutamyl-tRNA(Gln) and/or aspartyl-tRNA(Asn) amidotransferase, B subunit [Parcubacteria group bacterium Gr01-1014_30]|nr:MAG: glutamyl-tRNA(Gln) and/or aspartyl-tRNA(Asn) amidotransferase, B subunit [Parcubacteria group bacterium Gr01-1014_30]
MNPVRSSKKILRNTRKKDETPLESSRRKSRRAKPVFAGLKNDFLTGRADFVSDKLHQIAPKETSNGVKYQPTVGLEVHVELKTASKMFCSCSNDPDEKRPNVNVCPVCMGHPGTLPVINAEALRKTIKTGLALNCEIPEITKFDRKNYFYPDLPKGYQISQYDQPLCVGGSLLLGNLVSKKIRIRRVHLEEDTGRLLHEKGHSLVDFNRAGFPLMELVTEPDLDSAKEARAFAEELQLILRYLGVSDANMEKGQMRVEANVSLAREGKLGTKVEIKNLNSFRAVEKATDYEISRQSKVLTSGKKVIQETKGWQAQKEVTVSQREKEEAHDYRYFPEPDLPPLRFTSEKIDEIRAELPELPQQRRARFQAEYGLTFKEVALFAQNKALGDYYEKAASELRNWAKEIDAQKEVSQEEFFKLAKLCSNYIITDLQGLLKGASVDADFRITPENFAEFVILIYRGQISSKTAKLVLEEMFFTGADPTHIIEEKGLAQITDAAEVEKIVKEVILQNPKGVEDFRKGKEASFQFLVGKVMSASKGRASPEAVHRVLRATLTKLK